MSEHLMGDINFVGPVCRAQQGQVLTLTWTAICVVRSSEDPDWLNDVAAQDEHCRGGFTYCRGAGELCFAARAIFVKDMHILGEGANRHEAGLTAGLQWLAARVTPHKPIAGLTTLNVGAILIGKGPEHLSQRQIHDVAESLADSAVRVVMMIADPPRDIRGDGEKIVDCLRWGCVPQRTALQIGEAFHNSVQLLVIGRNSGFEGDLSVSSAVAERPLTRGQWKQTMNAVPRHSLQGTLEMLLPPIRTKIASGVFCSVWFQGVIRRKVASKVQRNACREVRRQRQPEHSRGAAWWWEQPPPWRSQWGQSSAVAESSRRDDVARPSMRRAAFPDELQHVSIIDTIVVDDADL